MRIERFRVRRGDRTALTRHDPADTGPFGDKDEARVHLQKGLARLDALQETRPRLPLACGQRASGAAAASASSTVSYYEEVLIVRIHRRLLDAQKRITVLRLGLQTAERARPC